MADLKSSKLIYFKGFLFLAILASSASLIIFELPSWYIAILVGVTIWASARFYYFMFYVIEKYVDSNYKFAGILSFLKYTLTDSEK